RGHRRHRLDQRGLHRRPSRRPRRHVRQGAAAGVRQRRGLRRDDGHPPVAAAGPVRARLMDPLPRPLAWLALAALVVLALLPQFAERYTIQLLTRIMIMGIFAMSLGLLVSGAGLVSLGHAAFFGLAAYTLALFSPADAGLSIW